jgi:hypothetical protein
MNPNTATEYRDLPLAVLTESATNPRRIFEDAALKELAESIRSQGVSVSVACATSYRPELRDCRRSETLPRRQNCRGFYCARPYCLPHRCGGTGGAADRIIYSWQEFSLSLCDLARRLYVIDVPGLPQIDGYNGLSPPRAMACGPDSRFSTLVIRQRIQSNSPRETLLTVVISGLATMRPEHGKLAADWLDRWTGHLTTTDFSQY